MFMGDSDIDFTKCGHYDDCPIITDKLDRIDKENVAQESSLKALHKRLDNIDSSMYKIADTVSSQGKIMTEQGIILSDHMKWEEKYQSILLSLLKWVVGIIVTIVIPGTIAYLVWSHNNHTEKMVAIAGQKKVTEGVLRRMDDIADSVASVASNQENMNSRMLEIAAKTSYLELMQNRNYGYMQGKRGVSNEE